MGEAGVKGPCLSVRLIRPTGEIAFTEALTSITRAEDRFKRLVEACIDDGWIGARVQCLNAAGEVVHERRI